MERNKQQPQVPARLNMECFDINIDGQNITVNPMAACQINDLSEGMSKVASEIAFYGSLLGAAEKARDKIDAAYRSWKAQSIVSITTSDPKLSEWKAKAVVEADPQFQAFKQQAAEFSSICSRLYWLCQALKHKAESLRSLGATERTQAAATGMATKEKPE